ncbi:MAG: hypothetical protein P9L97_00455 [Candidatus Tenebribacter davisii]|nr:hypothetical protein [Candidatus Tenebribacter davisii]
MIKSKNNTENIISKTSQKVSKCLRKFDFDLETRLHKIDKSNISWFIIKPSQKVTNSLFHTFSRNSIHIIIYGNLILPFTDNPAEKLYDTWITGGVDSARQMNGCFSAIIIDERNDEVIAFSDIFGLRRLKYYSKHNTTIISTQDIPVLATGLVPINFDPTSLYSILFLDWSLRGKSLIQNICSIHPTEILSIKGNKCKIVNQPLITDENRIDINNKKELKRNVDETISLMQQEIELRTKSADKIYLDLTAGRDSRAILGLILSKRNIRQKIFSRTMGNPANPEVRTAQKIAKIYSLEHENTVPQISGDDSFIKHAKLLSFAANGDTTSLRAIHPFPNIEDCHFPKFNGIGTGIYYRPKLHKQVHDLSRNDIQDFMLKKTRKIEIKNNDIQSSFNDRLHEGISEVSDQALLSGDALTLFYLYERMSIWGSMVQKSNWNLREFSPFASSRVIQKTIQLPLIYNLTYPLHKEIITRYIPQVYWMEINYNPFIRFPFFSLPDRSYNLLTFFQKRYYSVYYRLARLHYNQKSIFEIRSDYFSNNLESYLNDVLLEENSISRKFFGMKYLRKMISDHVSKKKNFILLLGKLVSIEEFRKLVEEIL